MTARRLVCAFIVYRWTLGLVLMYLGGRALADGLHARPHDLHATLLGALEAIAALLFLWPWTLRVGAFGLLVVIGLAFALHAMRGQFAALLLVYAAGVCFVLVHGPVSLSDPRGSALPAGGQGRQAR